MALQRDWSDTFNLAGVAASAGQTKNNIVASEGYYTGIIEDNYIDTDKNANRISLRIVINNGQFKDSTCWGSIMRLGSTEFDNRKYWRALYESIGLNPAHLDNGSFQYGSADLNDKVTCFYWKPGDRSAGVWSDLKFLSPMQWKAKKQAFEAAAGSAVSGQTLPPAAPVSSHGTPITQPAPIRAHSPAPVPTNGVSSPPQAAFAPSEMNTNDLMAMLNQG